MPLHAYMGQKVCCSIHAYFVSYIGAGCQRNAPTTLPPGKISSTHRTGGWVGPGSSGPTWRRENIFLPTPV